MARWWVLFKCQADFLRIFSESNNSGLTDASVSFAHVEGSSMAHLTEWNGGEFKIVSIYVLVSQFDNNKDPFLRHRPYIRRIIITPCENYTRFNPICVFDNVPRITCRILRTTRSVIIHKVVRAVSDIGHIERNSRIVGQRRLVRLGYSGTSWSRAVP